MIFHFLAWCHLWAFDPPPQSQAVPDNPASPQRPQEWGTQVMEGPETTDPVKRPDPHQAEVSPFWPVLHAFMALVLHMWWMAPPNPKM